LYLRLWRHLLHRNLNSLQRCLATCSGDRDLNRHELLDLRGHLNNLGLGPDQSLLAIRKCDKLLLTDPANISGDVDVPQPDGAEVDVGGHRHLVVCSDDLLATWQSSKLNILCRVGCDCCCRGCKGGGGEERLLRSSAILCWELLCRCWCGGRWARDLDKTVGTSLYEVSWYTRDSDNLALWKCR